MNAWNRNGHSLHDRKGSFYSHQVIFLVSSTKNQSIWTCRTFYNKILDGRYSVNPSEIKFVVVFFNVKSRFFADHSTDVSFIICLVFALDNILVFVLDSEIRRLVVTYREKSLYFSKIIFIFTITNIRQLFLVIFHHFSFGMILTRIIHHELWPKEIALHFAHIRYMVLWNMNIACRKHILW